MRDTWIDSDRPACRLLALLDKISEEMEATEQPIACVVLRGWVQQLHLIWAITKVHPLRDERLRLVSLSCMAVHAEGQDRPFAEQPRK